MWLSLLLLVLVLAIAFFQATQGLFNALLMVVLTICCAGAAFGTFEWVAIHWLSGWRPDFAQALALSLTFGLPLLLLRLAFDRLIRRAPLVPAWVDRVGGGICGLPAALIMVGVAATALQMVPFNREFLGYARIHVPTKDPGEGGSAPKAPDPDAEENELFLQPDRFSVAVASMLSDGVFSGARGLKDDNPDLVQTVGWLNAVPTEVSRYAPPGSISVVRTESVPFVYRLVPGTGRKRDGDTSTVDSIAPKDGHQFRMVRVKLGNAARDRRKSHVFTLRQFRLVGRRGELTPLEQYHAVAIQQDKAPAAVETVNRHIQSTKTGGGDWPVTDDPFLPRSDNNDEVEIVFELPPSFTPTYLEYKRGARVNLTFDASSAAQAEPATTAVAPPPPPPRAITAGRAPDSGRGGNIRRYTPRAGKSLFGEELPVTLKSYQKLKNAEIIREALIDGHLMGNVNEQEEGRDDLVSKFAVPQDKRLLQLNTGYLKAKSGIGKAISFAIETSQNYFVEDSSGNRYEVIGKYAVADVEGKKVVEIQYFSTQVGTIGGMGKFQKIKDQHLKGDYELVFLFLVDPGVQITAFSTGGSAARRDDLAEEQLTAPP